MASAHPSGSGIALATAGVVSDVLAGLTGALEVVKVPREPQHF